MFIERIYARDFGPIKSLDWTKDPYRPHTFVRGLLGKTTLLNMIAKMCGKLYDFPPPCEKTPSYDFGVLLGDLPGPLSKMWIWSGPNPAPQGEEILNLGAETQSPAVQEALAYWKGQHAEEGGKSHPRARFLVPEIRWDLPNLGDRTSSFERYLLNCYGLIFVNGQLENGDDVQIIPSSSLLQCFGLLHAVSRTNLGDVILLEAPFDSQHLSNTGSVVRMVQREVEARGGSLVCTTNGNMEAWKAMRYWNLIQM